MFPILLSSHSRHWLWWSQKSHLKMGWSLPGRALQEYNQGRGYKRWGYNMIWYIYNDTISYWIQRGWSLPDRALQEYNQGRGYKRRHKASLAELTWGFLKRINLKKDHSIPCPSNRQNPCECSFLTSVSGSMSFVTWSVLTSSRCWAPHSWFRCQFGRWRRTSPPSRWRSQSTIWGGENQVKD